MNHVPIANKANPDGRYKCLLNYSTLYPSWLWRLRRWQGRVLSILRLPKATLTFRGCLDYAAWEIEHHTDVHVEIMPAGCPRIVILARGSNFEADSLII